jgi:hypothetical protein
MKSSKYEAPCIIISTSVFFLSVLVQILSSTLSQLGVVVSVLATGPKGFRFKAYPCDRFLRAMKICSMPSFGWKVKPESPRHKILQHIKNHLQV